MHLMGTDHPHGLCHVPLPKAFSNVKRPIVIVSFNDGSHCAGGNSFNQLAVLATYTEAHLPAVYYYYRSLAVAQPFQVARENLLLLFEQNRVQYEQLGGSSGQGGGGRASRGRGRHRGPAAQQQQKPRVPIAALLPKLTTRFVRVHGALPCNYPLHLSSRL